MSKKVILSKTPLIYYIDNFVKNQEIEFIINASKDKLKKAHVSYLEKDKHKYKNYTGRTNRSYWLPKDEDPIVLRLCKRIAKEINCDWKHFENYQVIHYNPGEEYKYHYDAYDKKDLEKYNEFCGERGNRLRTVLVYLNDVIEGGGTGFDTLNEYEGEVIVEPKMGKMVVFNNVNDDGSLNLKSRHAGLPVIKGEKWAFNLWLRERE